MQIACPRCHARAELPASKEGAKVRCGECGRVYVAHRPGRGGRKGGPGSGTIAAFVVAAAAIVLFGVWNLSRDETQAKTGAEVAAPAPREPAGPALDDIGWSSPAVQTAVALHEAAYAHDTSALTQLLHLARIWEREQASDAPGSNGSSFDALSRLDRAQHVERWVEDLVRGEGRALVGEWKPYDGEVIAIDGREATVRLAVSPRDDPGNVEKRWVEWRLALDDGRWKAWSWERWLSPEELAALRRPRRGYEKVTLSDGSLVHEREPEPLEHLEDTPPELRARIDELYATMLDLDLTREAADAQHELVEIGRPAIPILLTGLYETPLDSEENAIRCNLVVQSLRRITGESFGYKPQVLEGSGVGTTEERRQSSIKQWFAWWYKNRKKFTEKQVEDGLEGLIELSEKEKRWLDRNQD